MMPDVSFTGLLLVAAVAFGAPLLVGLVPRLRVPAVVLEIVAGIALGPAGLGLVDVDAGIEVLSLLGLAVLLFLAGLEIDPERLRGRFLRVSTAAFGVSFAVALAVGVALRAAGFVNSALFPAIVLCATSLGLVIPVLKDAGESRSELGQLTIAGSSIADFAAVILLSLFFSREATGTGAKLVLLGAFGLLAAAIAVTLARAGRSMRIADVLLKLQDTTAELRVRGAVALLVAFLALSQALGLEVILAAFVAGAVLKVVDRDAMRTHPNFHLKLEAIGYGFLVPVFFVSSGLRFDLQALVGSRAALARVPLFLLALLAVRGLPALLYRPIVGSRRTAAAALLQATSLPFIVAATQIGLELGVVGTTNAAALVAAGLLSVLLFPAAALTVLRGGAPSPRAPPAGTGARKHPLTAMPPDRPPVRTEWRMQWPSSAPCS
jgi:Kef-type K+ transport system membrane component KefB